MADRITKFEKTPNSMFPYKLKDDSLCTELDSIHKLGLIEDLLDQYNVKDLEELDKLLTMATSYEELSKQIGCPLDVYWKLHTQAHIYDIFGTPLRVLGVMTDTVAVRPEIVKGSGHCFFYLKDYKKTWWLKETKEE